MSIVTKTHGVKAIGIKTVKMNFVLTFTDTSGAATLTGDNTCAAYTDGGVGLPTLTLNARNRGYELVGVTITPLLADPTAANGAVVAVLKSFSLTTGVFVFSLMDVGTPTARDPASGDKLFIELTFNDCSA